MAEYIGRERVKTYALERITNLRIGEKQLRPSEGITPAEFYASCYGIVRDERKAEFVRLRADRQQRCYLRAQPLHESQKEVESGEDYSVFEYYLRPSFDLFQKILWMRDKVEIVAPESVRTEFAALAASIARKYQTQE